MGCCPSEARDILYRYLLRQIDLDEFINTPSEEFEKLLNKYKIEMSCEEMAGRCGGDACGRLLRAFKEDMEEGKTPVKTDGEKIWLTLSGVYEAFWNRHIEFRFGLPEIMLAGTKMVNYRTAFSTILGLRDPDGFYMIIMFAFKDRASNNKFIKAYMYVANKNNEIEKLKKVLTKLNEIEQQIANKYGKMSKEFAKFVIISTAVYHKAIFSLLKEKVLVSVDSSSIDMLIDEIQSTIDYDISYEMLSILHEVSERPGMIVIKKDPWKSPHYKTANCGREVIPVMLSKYVPEKEED